ncbi:MAG: ferritin-like domain-containing protein [Rhodanobacteraceae bacterium]|nr:ferritin-like domain-containing protein [Rhodanobacteraceae bacterium]
MSFLKPAARPWQATDFAYSQVVPRRYDDDLAYILRTTALVESRADQYGDYLRAVFATRGPHWRHAIDAWNREEREHGRALRRLCEAQGEFAFEYAMTSYLAGVDYHACDGLSVRGSIAGELVARCVVEALASTFYRVLRDSCADETGRAVLHTLALDEARHYGMFRALLADEQQRAPLRGWQRIRVGLRRMLELSDDQILFAAWLVATTAPSHYCRRTTAARYGAALYPRYRFDHLLFAARLICPVLFAGRSEWLVRGFAAALWAGVQWRAATSRLRLALTPMPPRAADAPQG